MNSRRRRNRLEPSGVCSRLRQVPLQRLRDADRIAIHVRDRRHLLPHHWIGAAGQSIGGIPGRCPLLAGRGRGRRMFWQPFHRTLPCCKAIAAQTNKVIRCDDSVRPGVVIHRE